jgi:valyl-tRNA synthetase
VASNLPGNKKYDLLYQTDTLVEENTELIKKLAKLGAVTRVDEPRGLRLPNSGREAWLDIDADTLYEHRINLETRLAEVHAEIANLTKRLENKSYVEKAPKELVEETNKQLEQKQKLAETLQQEIEVIG